MMELVEHRRGVQRLNNDHTDHKPENLDSRVNGISIRGPKIHDDADQSMLSDCDSETSEVLSVGSEPMPNADGLDVDRDDPASVDNYESDAGTIIATRGSHNNRQRNHTRTNNDRSLLVASSPLSRSPSPSPSSSESCNPPQSPVSNYCVTPPEHQPSSPAASSVRSPASSSATASSPGRPDAHQEAIVPRYQSASTSLLHQNLIHNNHHHHHQHHQHPHQSQHLQLTGRYSASAIVSTTRDNDDPVDYPSVISASTLTRLPGIIGHHGAGLTAAGPVNPTVADLIGYSQQSIEASRLHGRPAQPAISVPLVTRLSLSPPTSMTVGGLQPTVPGTAFHPVAVAAVAAAAAAAGRDPRETTALLAGHPAHLQHSSHNVTAAQHPLLQVSSQVQHVAASTTVLQHHHHHQQQQHSPHHRSNSSNSSSGQHRLSVSKLLQHNSQDSPSARDAGSPVSPRGADDHSHQNHHHHHEISRSNASPGNNGLQNSTGVSITNNSGNHHRNNNNSSSNNNNNNNNNNVQNQGSLKFSIDNILKADFGRRITDPISLKKSRPKKLVPRPIDLTKDFLESSSEGSERGSETSTTNPSPGVPTSVTTANAENTTVGNVTGDGTTTSSGTSGSTTEPAKQMLWPAWVYCTRYSDRPSSGPRTRRVKRPSETRGAGTTPEEKRPRTAFSGEQLARLKREFAENRYLTERRRQQLSRDLGLNEAQIKIWFQNKRAKIKKASGQKNPLALQLMAQGLYNHSTVPLTKEEEEQAAELQAK